MPSTTIQREVTPQQAEAALRAQLGSSNVVTRRGTDSLTVKHGSPAFARVRLHWAGDNTAFHVHGAGISHKVTGALAEGLGPAKG
jgi:hypothetical protein